MPTECLQFNITVNEKVKGRWKFTVLDTETVTWSDFETRLKDSSSSKTQSEDFFQKCKEHSRTVFYMGKRGVGVITFPSVFGEIRMPCSYFFNETEIGETEVRDDWQTYKYHLIKVRPFYPFVASPFNSLLQ